MSKTMIPCPDRRYLFAMRIGKYPFRKNLISRSSVSTYIALQSGHLLLGTIIIFMLIYPVVFALALKPVAEKTREFLIISLLGFVSVRLVGCVCDCGFVFVFSHHRLLSSFILPDFQVFKTAAKLYMQHRVLRRTELVGAQYVHDHRNFIFFDYIFTFLSFLSAPAITVARMNGILIRTREFQQRVRFVHQLYFSY